MAKFRKSLGSSYVDQESNSHIRVLRKMEDLEIARKQIADEVPTASLVEQRAVEAAVLACYKELHAEVDSMVEDGAMDCDAEDYFLRINVEGTRAFLKKGLKRLSGGYACLDSSRPWLVYWIVHALQILDPGGSDLDQATCRRVALFLAKCQNEGGGFGGGPGQLSHLAPTYAAVNALAILSKEDETCLAVVDRPALAKWLHSLKLADGSFVMHADGEVDIRGVYCALSVAALTNVITPEMLSNTEKWLLSCQTYEGGFGGQPGMEAHGGYTFCGFAALYILKACHKCNLRALLRWAVNRQMRFEGGFQGRTNKLVDACYSFWLGGLFPMLHAVLAADPSMNGHLPCHRWLFNQEAMQEYVLACCQDDRGGLIDKPGKYRDFYHTCYALSGIAVAQNFKPFLVGGEVLSLDHGLLPNNRVVGDFEHNRLDEVNPVFNVSESLTMKTVKFFHDVGLLS